MSKNWRMRKNEIASDANSANNSDSSFDQIPEIVKILAQSRGFQSKQEIQNWVNPKLQDLKDPNVLSGISIAVDRLSKALAAQETVALYGDFDLDGTSALALLDKAFRAFGFKNIILYQPTRLTEGYGFHVHAVESLKQQNASVIVTADVGITSIAAAKKCKELNIDLILTDHHLPLQELPEALCIINPNQKECSSKLGHLCGVGVAFYLVWALKRKLIQDQLITDNFLNLKELLDCFVIGTLTDMVPLIDENRVLVKHGLNQLSQTRHIGIRLLLEKLNLWGRELSSQDVAIRFAPKLNALSRMELDIRPLDLFTVTTTEEAEKLVSKVMTQNEMRVSLQAEAENLALNEAQHWAQHPFVFICHETFHRGVIGLVATKLAQVYNKPAFVGSIGEGGEGIVVGSCRAPNESSCNLVLALEYANSYLHRFGGHAHAAGFEFHIDQKEEISEKFKKYFQDSEALQMASEIWYDGHLSLKDINSNSMQWLQAMGPYGQGFETPLFCFENVQVLQIKNLKGGHQRLTLQDPRLASKIDALLFSPTEEQKKLINNNPVVSLLAEPQWNYFQLKKSVQLLIKDIRV